MEAIPTFASALSLSTITPELQSQIDDVIAALLAARQRPPTKGEIVESPASGYTRLQDWAFTYGFCLAIESASGDRTQLRCVHQKKIQGTPGRPLRLTANELRHLLKLVGVLLALISASKSVGF
jgi:hypothetical protein